MFRSSLFLARVIGLFGGRLDLVRVEQHIFEPSGKIHRGLIGKMRGSGVAALAACDDGSRLDPFSELYSGYKTIPRHPVPPVRSGHHPAYIRGYLPES